MKTMQTWENDGLQFRPICSREQEGTEKSNQSDGKDEYVRLDRHRKRSRIRRGAIGQTKRLRQSDRQKRLRFRLCLRFFGICLAMTLCINAGLWGLEHGKKESRADENAAESDEEFLDTEENENALESRTNVDSAVLTQRGNDENIPAVKSTKQARSDSFDPEDPLLILVNKEHGLPEHYKVDLTEMKSGLTSVATVMYEALMDMLEDGGKEGLHFVVCSGYRSPKRQQELLDEDIRSCMAKGMSYEEAYDEATRYTMPPGFSEHSTGLAADIVALDYQLLDEGQEKTAENQWLRENAWKYGFILRYPADKEAVTQIDYESWHFRYVGKEAAKYMYEENLTLEEFLGV